MSVAQRFAEAGNEMVSGVMKIQRIIHTEGRANAENALRRIDEICEGLVGSYDMHSQTTREMAEHLDAFREAADRAEAYAKE